LNDVLTGTERVLTTPLPIAYAIAISQITWVYILLLPFQLINALDWVTIPASIAAAYIILGLLYIGREIENPFGQDVNDLPLESYCAQIATELDLIASKPKQKNRDWIETMDNHVLWPLSQSGWPAWLHRGEDKVREALKAKVELGFETNKQAEEAAENGIKKSHSHSHAGKVTVEAV
jgi:putative membrane protein